MDIANLQAFVAAAEESSFSAASERLHLTQPAISKRIAALETELAQALFDRIGRRVLLTQAGLTLLPRAKHILSEIEDSRRAITNLSGSVNGTLRVATSHHIGLHRLPPLLRKFASLYPGVQLDLQFTDSELGCDAVAQGDAELAIVTLPLSERSGLNCLPIWHDPLVIVANHQHLLAGAGQISPQSLAQHAAILPGDITFTRRIVNDFFASRNIRLNIAFSTNYLETIKMMVGVGLGWSVLPRSMLGSELIELTLPDFKLSRTLGAVLHENRTLSNAARAMVKLLGSEGINRQKNETPA